MPFIFKIPTTSNLNFSTCLNSDTHPSLPQSATTYRNILRSVLKKHRRLDSNAQTSNLSSVKSAIEEYLPCLFALLAATSNRPIQGEHVSVSLRKELEVAWRSTLASTPPGRDSPKIKRKGIAYEKTFALTALAEVYTLMARSKVYELYAPITPSEDQRAQLLQAATKDFLAANSIHTYLSSTAIEIDASAAVIEALSQTQGALAELAMAEATLLAVLKDDPYPFLIIQARNKNDKDWMIRPPELPKVRAHLFARLSLAAADHAAKAEAGLSATGRVDGQLLDYVSDLRKTARAKACRFLGIDAELEGQTGKAIAWLQAAKKTLGVDPVLPADSNLSTLRKLKKDWTDKREDRKIEKGGEWGSDAGKLDESRVTEYLEAKWTKMNDTINTQVIPPSDPLLANMPSGRDIHASKAYVPPQLEVDMLAQMRAPVSSAVEGIAYTSEPDSSDEEGSAKANVVPGTFPGEAGPAERPYY